MIDRKYVTIIVILFIQSHVSFGIKFAEQSVHVYNDDWTLVAKIPVQRVFDKKLPTKVQKIENAVLFVPSDGHGCDLENLGHPKIKMQLEWEKSENFEKPDGRKFENLDYILLLNALHCDLPTKIQNAYLAGYTAMILHNTVANDNPSSVVLEASDVRSNSRAIKIYFVGQKYGRLLVDLFTFPKRFFIRVCADVEDFYLTRFADDLEGNVPKKMKPKPAVRLPPLRKATTFKKTRDTSLLGLNLMSHDDFEHFLEDTCYFPRVLAFFGAMILWILQNGIVWAVILTCGFFGCVVLLSLTSPVLEFFEKYAPRARRVSVHAPDHPNANPPPARENFVVNDALMQEILRLFERIQELEGQQNQQAVPALAPEVIDSLLEFELNNEEATLLGICAICREQFAAQEMAIRLEPSCSHVFHAECIQHWLRVGGNCPNCRRPVRGNLEID